MAWIPASLRSGIAAATVVAAFTSASTRADAASPAPVRTPESASAFTSASTRADAAPPASDDSRPIVLIRPFALVDQPESIYPDPEPPKPNTGVNEGGVHLKLNVSYLTDYVYRGIDRSEIGAIDPSETGAVTEDAPNLQFDGKLTFDLGRAPHPFVGLFANVYNDDPISRFQEVRPYFGLDWTIRPLRLTAGWQTYIYPERDDFNTSEIFGSIEIDDSVFFRTDRPILSPYIYAAYDHDLYDGLYLEAGLKHDFIVEGTGITLTLTGNVGFVAGNSYFTAQNGEDTGFQHYEVGLIGTYSLNTLANISRRYGDWKLRGYLYYTDGLNNDLRADTQIWGGVGIGFDY